ncbi:MAG: SGNH/GDSL hydrolase family protein [Eubacteriaceae bacterium]|nr:SGNH/GDSL hydrolase family protein [Eubacteriaceae bacterium]
MNSLTIFGDSITKGIYLGEGSRYHILKDNFIRLFCGENSIEYTDRSKMGATVTDGAREFEYCEKEELEGVVLFEYGGNDSDFLWKEIAAFPRDYHPSKTPLKRFTATYEALIERAFQRGAKGVALLDLPPLEPKRYFDWVSRGLDGEAILRWLGGSVEGIYNYHKSYSQALKGICERTKAALIDIRTPFLEIGEAGDYLCIDGIHPNERGHKLIKKALDCSEVLRELVGIVR